MGASMRVKQSGGRVWHFLGGSSTRTYGRDYPPGILFDSIGHPLNREVIGLLSITTEENEMKGGLLCGNHRDLESLNQLHRQRLI